jgi:hypothetical protein
MQPWSPLEAQLMTYSYPRIGQYLTLPQAAIGIYISSHIVFKGTFRICRALSDRREQQLIPNTAASFIG